MSNITSATSSALFNAVKIVRATSSDIGRLAAGAPNCAGTASRDTPAVIPNHVKQTQPGLLSAARIRAAFVW